MDTTITDTTEAAAAIIQATTPVTTETATMATATTTSESTVTATGTMATGIVTTEYDEPTLRRNLEPNLFLLFFLVNPVRLIVFCSKSRQSFFSVGHDCSEQRSQDSINYDRRILSGKPL